MKTAADWFLIDFGEHRLALDNTMIHADHNADVAMVPYHLWASHHDGNAQLFYAAIDRSQSLGVVFLPLNQVQVLVHRGAN
ncbi:hypothetical protein O9929_24175 [Vibrio lentus]|nr:hypothetical protein [Vibrio lentus]